jgi:anti-anti-sigma factor
VERPELSISSERGNADEVIISLVGDVDMLTVGQLSAAVNEALTGRPSRVLLDMGGVTFCDSQGLGTLVVLSRAAASARSLLVLTNVADFLLRVLEVTGLRSALMIRNGAAQR